MPITLQKLQEYGKTQFRLLNINIIFYTFAMLLLTLLFGPDSDLEAFSRYLADCSFTALTNQLTVLANYLIDLFLSY